MKFIDSKGKLFGKISILDIILVVAILFLAVVFILGITKDPGLTGKSKKDIDYTLEIKAYNTCVTEQKPFTVGDKMYAATGEFVGEITKVEAEPYTTWEKLQDGKMCQVKHEGYLDYYVTIEGKGTSSSKGIYSEGKFALYPNNAITLMSEIYYGRVVVLSVEKSS